MLFSASLSCTRAAGGLSALQKNRPRPPNELLFFSLSEFRNGTHQTGLPGNVTCEVPGRCQTTSDQWELILPSQKTLYCSHDLGDLAYSFHQHVRIVPSFGANAAGSVVCDNELQVGGETGS